MSFCTAIYDVGNNPTTNVTGGARFVAITSVSLPVSYDYCVMLKQYATATSTYSTPYTYVDGNHGGETYSTDTTTYKWERVDGVYQYNLNAPETWTGTTTGIYVAAYDVTVFSMGANFTEFVMPNTGGSLSTPACGPYNGMGTDQVNDMAELARLYFDTPTTPSIDIRVYTTGINDPLVTWVWENLQNALPETDYYLRFGVSDVTPGDGLLVANVPYNNQTYQASLTGLYDALANTQQPVVDQQGYLYTTAILLHYDSNNEVVKDETYTFKITLADGNVEDEETQSGGDVNIYINTSPNNDDVFDPDTSSSDTPVSGQAMSVDNLLTSSYAISETNLRNLGAWLWGGNLTTLYDIQTAPIENILSCKRIPFDVTGTDTTVKLGNVDTLIHADKTSTTHKQTIGSITVPVKYGDYMDYMSNISIYLPYIGIQTIPTALCFKQSMENAKDKDGNNILDNSGNVIKVPAVTGRSISVTYIYDIVYGSCCADVAIDGTTYAYFNGMCGVDIPITASNRTANELSLVKQGGNIATGTGRAAVSGVAGGNPLGAVVNAVSNWLGGFVDLKKETLTQDTHYTTSGGMSSQIASYLPSSVILFVEQVVYTEPTTYKHENGYPCNISLNMKTLKGLGYTELDGSIEISNIPCLEEERAELKQALQDGFYINSFYNAEFDV